MLVCLIGHSSSGKSTIERKLYEDGYSKLISFTTRDARPNEVNGLDYHYISEEDFKDMEEDGFFHEVARYREWYYGISLNGIDLKNEIHIAVVTLHGYKELSKHTSDIIAIHIQLDERERVMRQLKRGDDLDEIMRRIHTDRVDFHGVEIHCDYIVQNHDLEKSVEEVKNIIEKHKQ